MRTGFAPLLALAFGVTVLAACRGPQAEPPSPPPAPTFTPAITPTVTPTPACRPLPTPTPVPGTPTYLNPQDHVVTPRDLTVSPITVLVYGDYQCEPCARLDTDLWRLLREGYPIRYVYRHFPLLPLHDKAAIAVQAAEAAGLQGAFWPFHRALYARQKEWLDLDPQDFLPYLQALAQDLGLAPQRLTQDMTRKDIRDLPLKAWELGYSQGMTAAPVVFVDGRLFAGPPTYENLKTLAALRGLETRRVAECPTWVLTPEARYTLRLRVPQGELRFVLRPEHAPQSVNAVVYLLQRGWYAGMTIYRRDGQALYLGDPSNTGYGHPGFLLPREAPSGPAQVGDLALEPLSPQWNHARWMLLLAPRGDLTVFARLVEGQETLAALQEAALPVPVEVELQP